MRDAAKVSKSNKRVPFPSSGKRNRAAIRALVSAAGRAWIGEKCNDSPGNELSKLVGQLTEEPIALDVVNHDMVQALVGKQSKRTRFFGTASALLLVEACSSGRTPSTQSFSTQRLDWWSTPSIHPSIHPFTTDFRVCVGLGI